MHGKPSYLPLERLRSAGAGKERVLAIGATPIFLYHGSDSRATVGHTKHHVSQWSVSPRHTRQGFFKYPSGLACLRSDGKALGREALHSAHSVFFLQGSGLRE